MTRRVPADNVYTGRSLEHSSDVPVPTDREPQFSSRPTETADTARALDRGQSGLQPSSARDHLGDDPQIFFAGQHLLRARHETLAAQAVLAQIPPDQLPPTARQFLTACADSLQATACDAGLAGILPDTGRNA